MIKCPDGLSSTLEKELAADGPRYMLAMYWQGRTDKIPSGLLGLLEWLTINGLPAEVAATWRGCRPGENAAFIEMDHQMLLDKAERFASSSLKH